MTSAEFTEALAFEQLEPDPALTQNRLLATLVALMANVYRDPKKVTRLYEPADFLPPEVLSDAQREAKAEQTQQFNEALSKMRAARRVN